MTTYALAVLWAGWFHPAELEGVLQDHQMLGWVQKILHLYGAVHLVSRLSSPTIVNVYISMSIMLVSNGRAFGPDFWLGLTSKARHFCRTWPSSTGAELLMLGRARSPSQKPDRLKLAVAILKRLTNSASPDTCLVCLN